MRYTTRAKRGMVFMCDLGNVELLKREQSSLQGKIRPVLVVSNDMGNQSSTMVNVLPITTREDTKIPVQVKFEYSNKPQVILIEQIRTVSQGDLKEYLYTISDELMVEVENGLKRQFAIRSPKDINTLSEDVVEKLETIVKRIIETKAVETQQKKPEVNLDDLALRLGTMIEDLFEPSKSIKDTPKTKPPRKTKTTQTKTKTAPSKPVEKNDLSTGKINPQLPMPELTEEEKKRREFQFDLDGRRNKVDDAMYIKFYKDFFEYSLDEMQCRYGVRFKEALFKKKSYIKSKLEKKGYDLSALTP